MMSLRAPWQAPARATRPAAGEPVSPPPRRPGAGPDLLVVAALLLATLAFYRELTLAGRVLLSFDALAYFYPNLTYLGAALREGRLPLWNPYLFAGAPFLANSQTGVLYPPNWLATLVPAARAYAWSTALHVGLAALGAYAFGRRALDLAPVGAAAIALVFALGGFFSAQVGHLNQLQAASWLPLLLLVADGLLRRPRAWLAVLGGGGVALQLLAGHTQVVYLSLWALLLYAAWLAAAALRDGWRAGWRLRALAAWLLPRGASLAALLGVGGGLAAAQLLPTYELAQESIRAAGLSYDDAASFSLPPWKTLVALLPVFGAPPIFSEWVAYVGVAGLALAGLALTARLDRRTGALLLLAGVGLTLALGQFSPTYHLAYRLVPGIDLFRVPARWLLLYSFGLAGLAGLGLDALARRTLPASFGASRTGGARGCGAPLLLRALALAGWLVAAAGADALARNGYPLELPPPTTLLAWALLAAATLALVAGGRLHVGRPRAASGPAGPVAPDPGDSPTRRLPALLLLGLLAGELFAASLRLDLNRGNLPAAVDGPLPEASFFRERPGLYRALGVSENTFEVGRLWLYEESTAGQLSPEGLRDYLVALKHRKTLTPNLPLADGLATLDGYDGGVLPLRRYLGLKALFPAEGENLPDGRLRVQLRTAPDPRLLGWLNVRYLVMDRARDVWLGGIYHDLAMLRYAGPGEPLDLGELPDLPPFLAGALSFVGHLEEAAAPDGTLVAEVLVEAADGRTFRLPLRAGLETAEGRPTPGAEPALPPVAPGLRDPAIREYAALLRLPEPVVPRRIAVEYVWPLGHLGVRAISLVGPAPGEERVVNLSPDLKLAYLGDAKIYEHQAVLPRAFVVGQVRLAESDEEALALLGSPELDLRREAVVDAAEWQATGGGPLDLGAAADVAVLEYRPERLVIVADLAAPGLLVVTDAAYPGWRALIYSQDGQGGQAGQEQPILRTDYLFRGVRLPAGQHRLELRFEPASLQAGLQVSRLTAVLALLVVALAIVRAVRRVVARRRGGLAEGRGERPA